MQNKKLFLILTLSFVLLIGGAAVLYSILGDENDVGQLGTLKNTEELSQTVSSDDETASPEHLAPDFTVLDQSGQQVKLSDMRGKPVVVNFWATWCGYCKLEMPHFETLYAEYGDEVVFMMINLTDGNSETIQTASDYINGEGYTFPVYFDVTEEAMHAYQAYSIPLTYFINEKGEAIAYASGALDEENLRKGIEMVLPKS